ncbi:MAG: fumarylacetoacetate hydrolase family protein [Magnetococcales bacterium]|nr:fumarylacetoacetate hydrolase family protein [Magnetococcales bacterium]
MAWSFPPPTYGLTVASREERFPIRRIFCIGRNYAEHAQEMGAVPERTHPFFFQKSPEAVLAQPHAGAVLSLCYPSATQDLQHEAELVVALGQGGREIAPEQAVQHIFGYAIGLDMTRRDLQAALKERRLPWDMAKNFEDAAPIGLLHPIAHTGELCQGEITLTVNGVCRQRGRLEEMIWSVNEIIAELSRLVTLLPGDLLFTGTPAGVGPLRCPDHVCVTLEPLGTLEVTVQDGQGHYARRFG